MVSPVYIRPLLASLAIAAVIGVTVLVVRNGSDESAPLQATGKQLPGNIDVALKKVHFSEIKDGLIEWELLAERVQYDKSGDVAYLTDIRMDFPKTPAHGTVTVTADNGEYSSSAKIVRLKGNIQVITKDGARFRTSSIVYSGGNDLLTTTEPVDFRQQRLHLTAIGMELGVKSQKARFFSMIDASIASW